MEGGCPAGAGCSNLNDQDSIYLRYPYDGGDGWGVGDNDDYEDLHLEDSSLAANAGDNCYLPVDIHNLDRENDTAEPLPVDQDGNPRIIGGTVD